MIHPASPRWVWALGLGATAVFLVWSFRIALGLPIDTWDAYDYLVNARYLAGNDLSHLAQAYRTDRAPGISLLIAPFLSVGYQPGQRGLTGLIHLVPWSLGILAILMTWSAVEREAGVTVAFVAAGVLALNPLVLHFLPFIMADIASMAFVLLALRLSERVTSTRRGVDVLALALAVGLALVTKYPMALLGLAIPVANLAWVWTGKDRPASLKSKLLASVDWRLATGLLLGLGLFFAVHALIYSRVVTGDGTWMERLSTGLKTLWGEGGGPGATDPWWELPNAVWWTFGPPVTLLAIAGAGVVIVRDRDRAGWLHLIWALALIASFMVLFGHKESRYVLPALPSIAILAGRGLTVVGRRVALQGVLAAIALIGIAPSALRELQHMGDPLYTRPSLLAWARFALDRAGADRPIIQNPNISPFALYAKDPVVFANDEFWHYHHINHGGLEWFFDRRLQALQVGQGPPSVSVQNPWIRASVPAEWLQSLGEDALWLVALPKGGLLLSPPQGWFETSSAAQQPEPPPPFVAIDLTRVSLKPGARSETSAEYSDGKTTVVLNRQADGWRITSPPKDSRWFVGVAEQAPRRWTEPSPDLPPSLDGLWSERQVFPVRP
ncbi:MAG: glycosyltransferase family 39 protein [Myxococcales bacterium]|nr:glycosyltransferase family 39 protein [Myxococcales bacterium]